MSYRITDCTVLGPSRLRAAMNRAFSDYVVPLSLSEKDFLRFQKQRGYSARHSFVALAGDEIAGFWLAGAARADYGNRAYSLSVGTLPEHRRKGVSRQLFEAVARLQRLEGAKGLQHEVLTNNSAALASYEAMGFSVQRPLRICTLDAASIPDRPSAGIHFAALDLRDIPAGTSAFFEACPTPQNSMDAIAGLWPDVCVVGAWADGALTGWGAAYSDGAVAQIAVHENRRRHGIGSALLHRLADGVGTKRLSFVNVDEGSVALNAFLDGLGAQDSLRQFDLRLSL